jgi:predicted metal-dependent HD superfamily phosphohydrolase
MAEQPGTMEAIQTDLLSTAERYVQQFYENYVDEKYLYHNFQHTRDVTDSVKRLVTGYNLSPVDQESLMLASWFHDTGYNKGAENHEERSVENLREFLSHYDYPLDRIEEIAKLILVTKISNPPQTLMQEIMRDADYSHLGSELYWDRCSRVRQELLMTQRSFMTEEEWVQFELDFITNHTYYTDLARQFYDNGKFKNIKQLRKYQQRIAPGEEVEDKKRKKKKKTEKLKEINLGRGVETMYRNTYRTHISLSSIADNKANIMLSINAIIISILISNLVPQFKKHPNLIWPTFILLGVCLSALVFAILSTRPKITKGMVTREDIEQKKSNLLFFGNYYNMELKDFQFGMMEMLHDNDFLYSSMTRDLYYLGKVLAAKYRYLNICYGIFMFGLIVSVISFGIAYVLGK